MKSVAASMFAIFSAARFIKKAERIFSKGLARNLALVKCIGFSSPKMPYKQISKIFQVGNCFIKCSNCIENNKI